MSSPHDFDFLAGRWTVAHRRLQRRLEGCEQWDDFAGTCELRPILDGQGNLDENVIELPGGTYRAATLRVFDPVEARWSIWWIDARRGQVEPPVRGTFTGGVGTFYGEDRWDGRAVLVRFLWTDMRQDSACWAQAFSADGGQTWETNWTMQFTRVS